MTKAPKVKKLAPKKRYRLLLDLSQDEKIRLLAVAERRSLPRSILFKSLLKDEANRLGIP